MSHGRQVCLLQDSYAGFQARLLRNLGVRAEPPRTRSARPTASWRASTIPI